jgi:hypothetical protein
MYHSIASIVHAELDNVPSYSSDCSCTTPFKWTDNKFQALYVASFIGKYFLNKTYKYIVYIIELSSTAHIERSPIQGSWLFPLARGVEERVRRLVAALDWKAALQSLSEKKGTLRFLDSLLLDFFLSWTLSAEEGGMPSPPRLSRPAEVESDLDLRSLEGRSIRPLLI